MDLLFTFVTVNCGSLQKSLANSVCPHSMRRELRSGFEIEWMKLTREANLAKELPTKPPTFDTWLPVHDEKTRSMNNLTLEPSPRFSSFKLAKSCYYR